MRTLPSLLSLGVSASAEASGASASGTASGAVVSSAGAGAALGSGEEPQPANAAVVKIPDNDKAMMFLNFFIFIFLPPFFFKQMFYNFFTDLPIDTDPSTIKVCFKVVLGLSMSSVKCDTASLPIESLSCFKVVIGGSWM